MLKFKHLGIGLALFVATGLTAQDQVGINTTTPDNSAVLDIVSPSADKGVLFPRLTTAQRDAIANPADGLTIYNTTTSCLEVYQSNTWVCNSNAGGADADWNVNSSGSGLEGVPGGSSATGTFSLAAGSSNSASGLYSVAFGRTDTNAARSSSILGGENNKVHSTASYSIIGAGQNNEVTPIYSSVLNGNRNIIDTNGIYAWIGSGSNNYINKSTQATILNGFSNEINTPTGINGGQYNWIGTGAFNKILGSSSRAIILGGNGNRIDSVISSGVILNGQNNRMEVQVNPSFIGVGANNVISNLPGTTGFTGYSVMLSGSQNKITGRDASSTFYQNWMGGGFQNHIDNAPNSVNDATFGEGFSALVMGYRNYMDAARSFMGVGAEDTMVTRESGVILAGRQNKIDSRSEVGNPTGTGNTILNGFGNKIILDPFTEVSEYVSNAFIGSGTRNRNDNSVRAFIGTGTDNSVFKAGDAFIGTGHDNHIIGFNSHDGKNAIVTGAYDSIVGRYNFMGSVERSIINGSRSAIVSGNSHDVLATGSFVGSGDNHRITESTWTFDGAYSGIVTGASNRIEGGGYSFIGGGSGNKIFEEPTNQSGFEVSSIVGGNNNEITAQYAFIGGGRNNVLEGNNAAITSGEGLQVNSSHSTVIGRFNTVAGNKTSWVNTDPLFVAGNGTSTTDRSNAFTVLKNGNTTIAGNATIQDIALNAAATQVLVADANGLVGFRNAADFGGGGGGGADNDWTVTGNNMYSNPSGNVGIGITNPANKLHVRGGAFRVDRALGATPSNNPDATQFLTFRNTNKPTDPRIFDIATDANNNAVLRSVLSDIILTGGNVGIQTNNPDANLHLVSESVGAGAGDVERVFNFESSTLAGHTTRLELLNRRHTAQGSNSWSGTNLRLQRVTDTSPMGFIDFGIDGASIDNQYSRGLALGAAGTTRMVIDNDGLVGIGTTTPSELFHVAGNTLVNGSLIKTITNNAAGEATEFRIVNNDGAGNIHHYWNTAGTASPTYTAGGAAFSHTIANINGANNNITMLYAAPGTTGGAISWQPGYSLDPDNGNFGIGTGAGSAKLDVNGNARIRTIPQNEAATRVLVADANGNVQFRDAANLGGGGSGSCDEYVIAEQRVNNNSSSTLNSGWRNRSFTTVSGDLTSSNISVSGANITLQPGTYKIVGLASHDNMKQARLRSTGGQTVALGSFGKSSHIDVVLTVTAATVYQLSSFQQSSSSLTADTGEPMVIARLKIQKID